MIDRLGLVNIANAMPVQIDPCMTVTSGAQTSLEPGWYQVSDVNPSDWHYTMDRTAGTCDSDGKVYVGAGQAKTCEMTNTYVPPPCPSGTTGIFPACVPIEIPVCPSGMTGIPPNCMPMMCPPGTMGMFPVCMPIDIPVCPQGTTGIFPVCVPIAVDLCSNLEGTQTEVPFGMERVEGQCVARCDTELNLIQNGGFEAPALSFGAWTIETNQSITKWFSALMSNSESSPGVEVQNHAAGSPAEGQNLAELDGNAPTRIWQSIPTKSGYDYALTFKYSPRPGTNAADNTIQVRKDDVAQGADLSRGSTSGDTEWTSETRSFIGTGAATKIEFADLGTPDSLGSYLDDVRLSCVGVHVAKATVVATKVVCDNESNLPDWSGHSHVIGATTAADFITASEGKCHLAPEWKFQWSPTSAGNPGDNVAGEVAGWNTFTSSALITLGTMTNVWVREVYDPAYVAFTGTADTNLVSAEMYCNGDAMHYDNLDYANGLADGATVYCVAFNALKPVVVIADTTMSITVIKHVVNDNGGTKDAEDFTLHVRQPVDMCSNIPEAQAIVPVGMVQVAGECRVPVIHIPFCDNEEEHCQPTLNAIFDWFSVKTAYAGEVLFSIETFSGAEDGTVVVASSATDYVVTEDADAGYSTTYGEGCTGHLSPGQHKTCIVTNNDIAPVPPSGGGGSSSFDYFGCTNPSASNFNALANRDDNSCVVGGGNGNGEGSKPEGEALGATTVSEPELPLPAGCSAYILTHMKLGKKSNDVEDVKRLQTFLNEEMGSTLPVSGFFGSLTKSWVKKFQKAHRAEIIQPWIDAGHNMNGLMDGSGIVYKTTKRAINIAKCATVNEPMPDLTNDKGMAE